MDNTKQKATFKHKKSGESIRISDLYLGSFLKAKGVILKGICRRDKKVVFLFEDTNGKIQSLINEYYNDCPVPVLRFLGALRSLRSIIFDSQYPQGDGQ